MAGPPDDDASHTGEPLGWRASRRAWAVALLAMTVALAACLAGWRPVHRRLSIGPSPASPWPVLAVRWAHRHSVRPLPALEPASRVLALRSTQTSAAALEGQGTRLVAISSHHIYNKNKKRFILRMANKYKLTGLYKFGKPGRILIEGAPEDVKEYVKQIKSLTWQRLSVMDDRLTDRRLFTGFIEVEEDEDIRTLLAAFGLGDVYHQLVRPW
eukprot:EG_transcript_19957